MGIPKRKKLYVDKQVQGAIVRRVIAYWTCCLLFLTIPLCIGLAFRNPNLFFFEQLDTLWNQYWPIFVSMTFMLPFFIYDVIKLSNRFVGPLVRLRRGMQQLANGEQVNEIFFREGDYWHDLAISFNTVAENMNAVKAGHSCGSDSCSSGCSNDSKQSIDEEELHPVGSGHQS